LIFLKFFSNSCQLPEIVSDIVRNRLLTKRASDRASAFVVNRVFFWYLDLIITQNTSVVVSNTVCAHVGGPRKCGVLGPRPIGTVRGSAWPWKYATVTPVLPVKFAHSRSNYRYERDYRVPAENFDTMRPIFHWNSSRPTQRILCNETAINTGLSLVENGTLKYIVSNPVPPHSFIPVFIPDFQFFHLLIHVKHMTWYIPNTRFESIHRYILNKSIRIRSFCKKIGLSIH